MRQASLSPAALCLFIARPRYPQNQRGSCSTEMLCTLQIIDVMHCLWLSAGSH